MLFFSASILSWFYDQGYTSLIKWVEWLSFFFPFSEIVNAIWIVLSLKVRGNLPVKSFNHLDLESFFGGGCLIFITNSIYLSILVYEGFLRVGPELPCKVVLCTRTPHQGGRQGRNPLYVLLAQLCDPALVSVHPEEGNNFLICTDVPYGLAVVLTHRNRINGQSLVL